MAEPIIDLHAPFERDTIIEIRRGKMKPMPGLAIKSGIDKSVVDGPLWVSKTGLEHDEQDRAFHGGPTKAVHAYCSSHYPTWSSEHPSASARFVPGGFGENFVFKRMNERNICIGDVFEMGTGPEPLQLEVSQPRQPCFKLNHRFQLKNFAPQTTRLSRTGWYFRVLREGWVNAGDQIRLVQRKYPRWTLEKIQGVMYRGNGDEKELRELLAIQELTDEIKVVLKNRLSKLEPKRSKKEVVWTDWKVVEKVKQTPRITSFTFEAVDLNATATPQAGSHVKIRLANGLVRAYSIVHGSRGRFELGVALDKDSRGGSKYLHNHVKENDILQVGNITPGIDPYFMAGNNVFIAAGIGITAFLWLIEEMLSINWSVQLHYAVRSADEIPFQSRLKKMGGRLVLYNQEEGDRMNISHIIKTMPWNSQTYVCGPPRLMDDALKATQDAGLSEKDVHFEAFSADVGGDAFEVTVRNRGNKALVVNEDETLLEVLQRQFTGVVESNCEVGNCGTCKVKVCQGHVQHRGTALSADEKKGEMLSCISRGVGKIEIEIGQ
ncbi:MOSC domain-containing protein [Paraphaeosphaeria minitans]|uniref:MOSC domain-containing protein n=1 Tax=Paraphaeosphaeria minitans TaxID=565426 RepID=A0A9P6GAD6_9PLEO|nr:MOSC domain-containing protein [Paraphaeosphaeria minitans]